MLSKKKGSRYEGHSEAEIARKLVLDALDKELTEGIFKDLPAYLSKRPGSQYQGKPLDVIRQIIIKNGLDHDIQSWLDEVNRLSL